MCEAIAAAHAAGITHRDLKPDNVMVDDAGRVKVLDFGLAKILDDIGVDDDKTVAAQTREGMILGTAAYMSPEQAEAKPVDERTDVFALGILLYELLTGKRPFQGDTHMSTLTSVMRDDPVPVLELRPELPRQFSRIVRRCLEKDPERRYESARGVRYDLEVLHAMGMDKRVPEAAAVALESLEGDRAANPDYANLVSAVAGARAFLGEAEAEQAVVEARHALELYPANIDRWIRSYRQLDLAHVLILAGRHEEAVSELAALLMQDTNAVSVGLLRISPRYDVLRDRADFAELLK